MAEKEEKRLPKFEGELKEGDVIRIGGIPVLLKGNVKIEGQTPGKLVRQKDRPVIFSVGA